MNLNANNKLPNFLLVGGMRSGTTSMYYYLKNHPEIYMPEKKELWYFVSSYYINQNKSDPRYDEIRKHRIFNFDDYCQLYTDVRNEKAIGDASTIYLYQHELAIENIKKYLGQPKIIIGLRNPVELAYSLHSFLVKRNEETLNFEQALTEEKRRLEERWDRIWAIKDMGFYSKQVQAYLDNFEQVKIYLYDDLKRDTEKVVREIYEFLEIDPDYIPYNIRLRYNESGYFINKYLYRLLKRMRGKWGWRKIPILYEKLLFSAANWRAQKNKRKYSLDKNTKDHLQRIYKDDLLKLEKIIDRDLSMWM